MAIAIKGGAVCGRAIRAQAVVRAAPGTGYVKVAAEPPSTQRWHPILSRTAVIGTALNAAFDRVGPVQTRRHSGPGFADKQAAQQGQHKQHRPGANRHPIAILQV